jgi:membrane protein CcdC involved in cytochrome C biogenesis
MAVSISALPVAISIIFPVVLSTRIEAGALSCEGDRIAAFALINKWVEAIYLECKKRRVDPLSLAKKEKKQ